VVGIKHKLNPEVKDFVITQKKGQPGLSCRRLSKLVTHKFNLQLSKSSINEIIKSAGLSLPVGRRLKNGCLSAQQPIVSQGDIKLIPAAPAEHVVSSPAEALIQTPIVSPSPAQPDISAPAPEQAFPPEKIQEPVAEPVAVDSQPAFTELIAPKEQITNGVILLKAADYLLGGSASFKSLVYNNLEYSEGDLFPLMEGLIYFSLFNSDQEGCSALWPLIGREFSPEALRKYLQELQTLKTTAAEINRVIPGLLQEGRAIKVNYSDGTAAYLDGQLRTVWSTQYLPFSFTATLYNIKSYINKYFYKKEPFVLFMPPGNDLPAQEFFDFLSGLNYQGKMIQSFTVFGNRLEELETIPVEQRQGSFFIFGLWPWQFTGYRQVRKMGEFKPFFFKPLSREFMLAEVELDMVQTIDKQRVSLRGCALKNSGSAGKISLVILSNLPVEKVSLEELAAAYLGHWPNLTEAYEDFNRKVEFFTYFGASQQFLDPDVFNLKPEISDLSQIFAAYLKVLDFYVKHNFFPVGYENKDFLTLKRLFYDLKAVLKQEKDFISVSFQVPVQFAFRQDLEYACRRLNEQEIRFPQGQVWFSVA
jgi:hypothetical protein